MYTIQQVAKMADISSRTLRYYDEISLLKPATLSESGYRLYTDKEIDLLQQILVYKSMDFPLDTIKELLQTDHNKRIIQLSQQLSILKNEQHRISQLIHTLQQTIMMHKGDINMSNNEKFDGLKQQLIDENTQKFGDELLVSYGAKKVEASNKQFQNMSQERFEAMEAINKQLFEKLTQLLKDPDIKSNLGKEVANLHKDWIEYTWTSYDKQVHKNLADMYLADERFLSYYDGASGTGATQLLRDCIYYHL